MAKGCSPHCGATRMIGASHRLRHWPLHATLAPETSTLVLLDLANPPKLRHGLGVRHERHSSPIFPASRLQSR